MIEDAALLKKFVGENSDEAFRTWVEGRFDFVYTTALRMVGGDAHLARDVAQTVFIGAARKARELAARPTVMGWLYLSTRFAAAAACRARSRRSFHEQKAVAMQQILAPQNEAEINWNEIRPAIDQALAELSEPDREALLLRYFSDQNFSSVGTALGLSENTARMRVERALDKLRTRLARNGITSTAAAITAALTQPQLISAPAGMASAVAGASLAGAAAAGGGATVFLFLEFMTLSKIALTVAGMAALGVGGYLGMRHAAETPPAKGEIGQTHATMVELQADNRRLKEALAQRPAATEKGSTPAPAAGTGGSASATKPVLTPLEELQVLAGLQERNLVKPNIRFINRQGKLDDAFVGLFALNPPERERLQGMVDEARAKLADFERANAKVTQRPDGKIVVEVAPFPVEGGRIYDHVMSTFAEVLGPERNEVYRKIGAQQFEDALGRFGAAERTYTFQYDTNDRPGQPYKFEDKVLQRTAKGGQSGFTNVTAFRTYEEMVAAVGPVVGVLPPGYQRK